MPKGATVPPLPALFTVRQPEDGTPIDNITPYAARRPLPDVERVELVKLDMIALFWLWVDLERAKQREPVCPSCALIGKTCRGFV